MNVKDIFWLDFETRAFDDAHGKPDANIKEAGTYRYAASSFPIVLAHATGEAPVEVYAPREGFDQQGWWWDQVPLPIKDAFRRAEAGEIKFAAFNAGFDRAVWNAQADMGWPKLEAGMVIDVMAQATASNLAPSLEGASRNIGRKGKIKSGKTLITLFCSALGSLPEDRPDDWAEFLLYARVDVEEMREVFRATRPLTLDEWKDYWVSERINERGVAVDVELARRAAAVADEAARRLNEQLVRWTNGQITAVTQSARIAEWVVDGLNGHNEASMMLVKEFDADVDPGDGDADLKTGKLSLEKGRVDAVLAYFSALEEERGQLTEREQVVVDVLTARKFGASTSPFKFQKIVDQHTGGRLRGQYVFNGASQTRRFSSKGVQTHNLLRETLGPDEETAIEMVNDIEELT